MINNAVFLGEGGGQKMNLGKITGKIWKKNHEIWKGRGPKFEPKLAVEHSLWCHKYMNYIFVIFLDKYL